MIRFGLIGYGAWGKIWARVLTNHPKTSLVAVGTTQSIPPSEVSFTTSSDYLSIIADPKVDAIVIASPPQFHIEAIRTCARARKPVIVEKPYVLDSSEAKEILGFWPQEVSFRINHVNLYHPAFQFIANEVRSDKVLEIKSVGGNRGPFRDSYSSLWDYGAHDISMALHLLRGQNLIDVRHELEFLPRKQRIGWESNHKIRLNFSSGAAVEIAVGNGFEKKTRTFEAKTDLSTWFYDGLVDQSLMKNGEKITTSSAKPLDLLLDSFLSEINGKPSTGDLNFGLQVVEVLEKCAAPMSFSNKG